ncbi:MAG: FAD-binding protein [Actinomycetota bacterium]|nr:FAD-binding protein [Actinomycetota bacterium]
MRVAVLVKAVPKIEELTLNEMGHLKRDGVTLEINPYCRRALAKGIELAEETGGECVVITMGPPGSAAIAREAVAVGADRAVVLTDPSLRGSDLLATARALNGALAHAGRFDLVLCGKASADAETAVLPAQIAELLGTGFIAAVRAMEISDGAIIAESETDDGWVETHGSLPLVISCAERLCSPRRADPEALAAVSEDRIEIIGTAALPPGAYGLEGSPTRVGRVRHHRASRSGEVFRGGIPVWAARAAEVFVGAGGGYTVARVPEPHSASSSAPALLVVADPKMDWLTHEMLGTAAGMASSLSGHVVVATGTGLPRQELSEHGADALLLVSDLANPDRLSADLSPWVQQHNPMAVLLPSTAWGREVGARLSVRLGCALVSDVALIEMHEGSPAYWKPALNYSELVEIACRTETAIVTLRPGSGSRTAPRTLARLPEEHLPHVSAPSQVKTVMRVTDDKLEPLARAEILIGVGLGVEPGDYAQVEEFADLVGAEMVATRKVTDRHWMPRSRQVGATGRFVAPLVYLAIGVSGKPMHMVGVRSARFLLAINSDESAPIFSQSDLGLVARWQDALPALAAELRHRGFGNPDLLGRPRSEDGAESIA